MFRDSNDGAGARQQSQVQLVANAVRSGPASIDQCMKIMADHRCPLRRQSKHQERICIADNDIAIGARPMRDLQIFQITVIESAFNAR